MKSEADLKAIKERGAEMVDQARETLNEAYGRASQNVSHKLDQALDYSRENPGKTTLIAFGAGIGVGLLLAGGFAPRSRTRRLVPPVMNALSEITSELFR
jgi:ElaB protein